MKALSLEIENITRIIIIYVILINNYSTICAKYDLSISSQSHISIKMFFNEIHIFI